MEFQAQSEEDIARAGLIEKGEYAFEIIQAENQRSKSGNDMVKVKLCVFLPDGRTRHVTDYLLSAMAAKLRHFCDATGLLPQYQRGTLSAEDCEGRNGTARIGVQEDKEGRYPPKNTVTDYVTRPAKPLSAATPQRGNAGAGGDEGDGSLPF